MNKPKIIKDVVEAIKANDVEGVRKLVLLCGILNPETPYGTWLHIAARKGKIDVVKTLAEMGADINKRGGPSGGTAINVASAEGNNDIVRYLYSVGARLEVDEPERNPLFSAITFGHIETVKLLLSLGIDYKVDYSTNKSKIMNAVAYARERGEIEISNLIQSVN